MAKYPKLKASKIPVDLDYPITLTGGPFKNEHDKYGTWWRWQISVGRDNPHHQSDYDQMYAYLDIGDENLQEKLSAMYDKHGYQDDGRTKADVIVRRSKSGNKNTWTLTAGSRNTSSQTASSNGSSGSDGKTKNPLRYAMGLMLTYWWLVKEANDRGIPVANPVLSAEDLRAFASSAGIYADRKGLDLYKIAAKNITPDELKAVIEAFDLEPIETDGNGSEDDVENLPF